jgi:hypothetical protein
MRLYIKSFYVIEENLYHYCMNAGSTIHLMNAPHHLDRISIEIMKLDTYKKLGVYDKYHDEIEKEFLDMFYINTLHILFTRFEPIPINVIFYITNYVLKVFPNYKKNLYLKNDSNAFDSFLRFLEMDLNEYGWNIVENDYKEFLK